MNFLTNLLNTYNKGLAYEGLFKEFQDLLKIISEERAQFTKVINDLERENTLTHEELRASKDRLKSLLADESLDINSLKAWYEGRRAQKRWSYDGRRLGKVDVKLYLRPSDDTPFITLAKELITKYRLTKDMKEETILLALYKYWNLKSSWKYRLDENGEYRVVDYWEDPTIAVKARLDDCETKAMCMYNTIKQVFILLGKQESFWRLTFVASRLVGYTGHGFLTWLHSDGEYYVIESTYDSVNSLKKTFLKTPMRFNNLYGTPWGFSTDNKSWLGSNSALLKFSKD